MRNQLLVLTLLLGALACGDDPKSPAADDIKPLGRLDRTAVALQLARLADDSMGGRGSGSAQELRSAQYIAQQFQSFGLSAVGSSYTRPFALAPTHVAGRTDATSQNVIAAIRGSGALRDEWLVLGAHYDHIGTKPVSLDSLLAIFNGADDNASGTALLLQLAQQLESYIDADGLGNRPRRSLMFIAFGAEELGLLGSEEYCAHPAYPLTTVAAMLNFDMVGRMRDNVVRIGGLATAAEWPVMLAEHNSDALAIWTVACENCTDFACFRRNERPVLWFYTGTHEDYHRPSDDVALINVEGVGLIGDLVLRLVADLLVKPDAPAFIP